MEDATLAYARERVLVTALEGETPILDARGLLTDPSQLRKVTHLLVEVSHDLVANPWALGMLLEPSALVIRAIHTLVCEADAGTEEEGKEPHTWEPSKPLIP